MRSLARRVAFSVVAILQVQRIISSSSWGVLAGSFAFCSHMSPSRLRASRKTRNDKEMGTSVSSQSDAEDERRTRRVKIDKTYENPPFRREVIDQEGAMMSFFSSREEWFPLFRSVAGNDLPKDTAVLLDSIVGPSDRTSLTIDITETSHPWKLFNAIPVEEEHRTVLARFLDSMQESLLAIPVIEQANYASAVGDDMTNVLHEDENDVQFVEEGRRLLAINRFHVLPDTVDYNDGDASTIESMDALFTHCWSEIMVLSQAGTVHSGSLILLSNQYELVNVRRFIEMNVIQPLQWLGIHNDFEICSFQRDSPAIRLIFKLNDLPATASYTEEDGFAAPNDN